MKFDISKEWVESRAHLEEGCESVEAGAPDGPDDLALQLALAKEVPEFIECRYRYLLDDCTKPSEVSFHRRSSGDPITDWEWDRIVLGCIINLPLDFRDKYYENLCIECTKMRRMAPIAWLAVTAKWQTKAVAYFKTKGITV